MGGRRPGGGRRRHLGDRLPHRYPYLTGTPALDDHHRPLHRPGVSTTVPGLGCVGIEFQRGFASNSLRGAARDAKHVLTRLRRVPRA